MNHNWISSKIPLAAKTQNFTSVCTKLYSKRVYACLYIIRNQTADTFRKPTNNIHMDLTNQQQPKLTQNQCKLYLKNNSTLNMILYLIIIWINAIYTVQVYNNDNWGSLSWKLCSMCFIVAWIYCPPLLVRA